MNVSARSIELRADELQPEREGTGRNGKPVPLYDIARLGAEAQIKWAAKQRTNVVEMTPGPAGQLALALTAPVGPNMSEADRAEAERRFKVIESLIEPGRYQGLHAQYPRKGDLIDFLCKSHSVKARTIYHWVSVFKEQGLPGLVNRDRSDKGRPRSFNEASLELILRLSMPQAGVCGVLSVAEIFRAYEEERIWRDAHAGKRMSEFDARKYARYLDEDGNLLPAARLTQASYETFRSWFNRIPEMVRVLSRDGVEAFHNTQEIISHRDISDLRPLEYLVMDHRVLDIFCLVRAKGPLGWRLIRPWLTAAIDMRTRKWLGWVIVETPSSDSIAAVLKRVFLNWGIPQAAYWDNGKDFRCEWLEGKHSKSRDSARVAELEPTWRGVLASLGVRVHHAIVKRARAKIIEPNFLNIANFDRTLPEYCGHKPTARPERFEQMVSWHEQWLDRKRETTPFRTIDQVAALYDSAIEAINEREHSGEGMRKMTPKGAGWMCPNEAWEILIKGIEKRTAPEDLLQMCFAKRKELTVKNGAVQTTVGGKTYYYRRADNPSALMRLNGMTVELAYDPLDLGEAALYYESRFIGLVSCVELRRMGEAAFVEDEKARRASLREVKKFIEAVTQAVPAADPETRLARRAAVTPDREAVPRVEVPVTLPASLQEAGAAARADRDFRFDQVSVDVVSATAPAETNPDDEFHFF